MTDAHQHIWIFYVESVTKSGHWVHVGNPFYPMSNLAAPYIDFFEPRLLTVLVLAR